MSTDRVIATVEPPRGREPEGLTDGGHIYPACSNCRAILMDIFITRPHEKDVWKVKATCPFCGDASFAVEVKGGFHMGGYGVIKPDNEDEDIASTVVDSHQIIGDTIVFKIMKASANAKPIVRR